VPRKTSWATTTKELGKLGWRFSQRQLRQRSRPSAFAGSYVCPRAFLDARQAQSRHQRHASRVRLREPEARLWCHRLGYAWQSTAKTKCKIQRFVFSKQPKCGGFVQARPHLTVCCLTLHSRGRPNGMPPGLVRGVVTFSSAQAWRHSVGLPLNSNVRHQKASSCACAAFSIRIPAA
jgi:hypothetical protein